MIILSKKDDWPLVSDQIASGVNWINYIILQLKSYIPGIPCKSMPLTQWSFKFDFDAILWQSYDCHTIYGMTAGIQWNITEMIITDITHIYSWLKRNRTYIYLSTRKWPIRWNELKNRQLNWPILTSSFVCNWFNKSSENELSYDHESLEQL